MTRIQSNESVVSLLQPAAVKKSRVGCRISFRDHLIAWTERLQEMQISQGGSCFTAGFLAFEDGLLFEHAPYSAQSPEHVAWLDGWSEARAEYQEMTERAAEMTDDLDNPV